MQEIDFHRALHRPGTIVDVGAHAGALTLQLAELPASRVLAFEPLPAAFARLKRAVRERFGNASNVRLNNAALGATRGTVRLEVPRVGGVLQEQWASTVKDYAAMQAGDPGIEEVVALEVAIITLDAFELTDVTAIKLDAEGAEREVLLGATRTLKRCRPVLSIETEERHRPGATRDVPALLRKFGYEGYYEFYGEWRPVENFDPGQLQRASPSPAQFEVSDPYVFCFYYVPAERREELALLARLDA